MIQKTQRRALILVAILLFSIGTVVTGPVAAAANPSISVSNAPDTVAPDSTFSIEYEIENTGSDPGSFTLEVPTPSSTVTVENIDGDIKSSDTSADPPSASTDAANPNGGTISVVVTYNTSGTATGDTPFELTASQPLDGTSDSISSTISVKEAVSVPEISVADGTDIVRQGNTYERVYTIANTGSSPGSFTLTLPDIAPGITVDNITGAIQSTNVSDSPPSATTDNINASDSITISVDYTVTDAATLDTYAPFRLSAEQPLDNTSDDQSQDITVKESEPKDPRDRATAITDRDSPESLTQNDISSVITLFNRQQTADGIEIQQTDISTIITLFNRNK